MKKNKLFLFFTLFLSSVVSAQLTEVPVEFSDDSWVFQLDDLKCRYRLPRFFVCSKGEDVEWDVVLPGKGKVSAQADSLYVYRGPVTGKLVIHRLIQDFSQEEQQLILFSLTQKKIEETKTTLSPLQKLKPSPTKEGKFIFGTEEINLPTVL
jgi:hypothetical protein